MASQSRAYMHQGRVNGLKRRRMSEELFIAELV